MKIPSNREQILELALRAKSGLAALGALLHVDQNNEARLTADLYNFVGEPGVPANTGAQGLYNKKHAELTDARAARNAARESARSLCTKAIDSLKAHLGRTWNPRWTAAGFGGSTLKITAAVLTAKLFELRNFFRVNPAREIASEGITEAAFAAEIAAVQAAERARDAALSDYRDARDARDAAERQLKSRLSGLQEELARLIGPADNRWADFGFPRPIDGSIPEPVEEVTATAEAPGTVLVQWGTAARATDFRVSWKPQGSSEGPIVAGRYRDRMAVLVDLPSGVEIEIFVTARNRSGESQPAMAAFTVP